MKAKMLSVLLAYIFIVCLLPGMSIPASAADKGTVTFYVASGNNLTLSMVNAQLLNAGVGTGDTFSAEFDSSVAGIANNAFSGNLKLVSAVIGDSVKSIGDSAFYNCTNLTSIDIGGSVTSIGASAFHSCSNLTSVVIPNSVTSIGEGAFNSCSRLTSLIIGSRVQIISKAAFEYCSKLANVVIPEGVTTIGHYAFRGCAGLTSVVIPNKVTSIGVYAFAQCTDLTKIVVGSSVKTIGDYAFSGCTKLTSIVIPDSVTSIGEYAVQYCSNLTSIVIGSGVTSIGNYAFYNCTRLAKLRFLGDQPSIGGSWTFRSLPADAVAYVREDAKGFTTDASGKWQGLIIVRGAPPLTLELLTTSAILEKCAANIQIKVTDFTPGVPVVVTLRGADGTVCGMAEAGIDGVALVNVSAFPSAGTYTFTVTCGEISGMFNLEVAKYDLGIWDTLVSVAPDGVNTMVTFGATPVPKSGPSFDGCVNVNGGAVLTGTSLVDSAIVLPIGYASLESGDKIVISGVKYANLFPSYSFTFTATVKR